MTVKELIKELSKLDNKNLEVYIGNIKEVENIVIPEHMERDGTIYCDKAELV